MIVSVARMSPSSNHRRAMPVVTMMTFHVGVSGVASRSRLTTPTFSSVGAEDLLGDRADGERLSRARSGDDAEALAADARELAHARAVVLLEKRLDVEPDRELDRLARRARRRDDDDASGRRLGADERVVIGEVRVADVADHAETAKAVRTERDQLPADVAGRIAGGFTPVKPFDARRQLDLVACLRLGRIGIVVAEDARGRWPDDSSPRSDSRSRPAAARRARRRSRCGTCPSADARRPEPRIAAFSRCPSATRCCAMAGAAVATTNPTSVPAFSASSHPPSAARDVGRRMTV